MAVSEAQNRATRKWKEKNVRRISLEVNKIWWEEQVAPAIKKSGESINGFIKQAITDRLEKETTKEKLSFAAWLEKEYGIEFPYFDNNFSSSESDRIYGEYHEYLDA